MDFSARMKKYEKASDFYLNDRLPIIIRCDGKAFHSYTRGLSKNSTSIAEAMDHAATVLCQQISGARLAYIQSDEISVLVNPWVERESQSWFDNCLQKIVSVAASICAAEVTARSVEIFGKVKPAYFDSRAFILPFDEINNYFVWRQQDATRNSIQVLGQMNFSHGELHKKSCNDIQEMLFTQRGINWNDEPVRFKRGGCIVKVDTEVPTKEGGTIVRPRWVNDFRIPVFSQDKNYIESRVRPLSKVVEEEKV